MELFTTTMATMAIGVGKAIGTYLMGKGGDYALEQASFKKKIKRIIKKDKKYIRGKFSHEKYTEYPIEDFLLEEVFQTPDFLYPCGPFPPDKSDELYKKFCNYVLRKDMDLKAIDGDAEFRTRIEDCVDYHNVLVHQIILSPSQRLMEKDIKEYITATGYAGHTLDPAAETLTDNPALEYTHLQIDGILRALRMDLKFYRLTMLTCTIGLMALAPILVALYSHYNSETIALIAAMLCSVAMTSILLFDMDAWRKGMYCEKKIRQYTEALWDKNFSHYSEQIDTGMLDNHYIDEYSARLYCTEEELRKTKKGIYKWEKFLDKRERLLDERERVLELGKDESNN